MTLTLFKQSWLSIVVWVVASSTLLGQPSQMDVSETTSVIEVHLARKSEFVVVFPSNPTTGYRWFLIQYDAQWIEPIKQIYKPSTQNKMVMGAGGKDIWFFKVKSAALTVPMITDVKMIYAQPWALSKASTTKTIKIVLIP